MIYVSSTCSGKSTIREAIVSLTDKGYRNIELSGGLQFDERCTETIIELQQTYQLNFLIHNYFPPPKNDFVLNLASLDDVIYEKSIKLLETALQLTHKLGADKFGFHAGFFVDRPVSELGARFKKENLANRNEALDRFCRGVNRLKRRFPDIKLYMENNCYSQSNYQVYGDQIPFMLLDLKDFEELNRIVEIDLLLDVGHLKVCANVLGNDFEHELVYLFDKTDYIHISDNDGCHDQNTGLAGQSCLSDIVEKLDWEGKTVTIEVYSGSRAVKNTYKFLLSMMNSQHSH